MIRALDSSLEVYPALGKALIQCPDCDGSGCEMCSMGSGNPLSTYVGYGGWPNLTSILTCDDPAEVVEMVEAHLACELCGARPDVDGCTPEECAGEIVPVTHWIYLWDGEPVEWEKVLWTGGQIRQNSPDRPAEYDRWPEDRLTAVVLIETMCSDCAELPWPTRPCTDCKYAPHQRQLEAAQACAEAGVQFVLPGDPETGRLGMDDDHARRMLRKIAVRNFNGRWDEIATNAREMPLADQFRLAADLIDKNMLKAGTAIAAQALGADIRSPYR